MTNRVKVGSILVPTPIKPPGTAYCRSFCSERRDKSREGIHQEKG